MSLPNFKDLVFTPHEMQHLLADACEWATMMQRWRQRGKPGCDVCGNRMLAPMLQHELWYLISKHRREVLCEECIERRLKRRLQEWDLLPCLWNNYRSAFYIVSKLALPP